ncbi:hypothetical protein [Aestuariivirga litoralis]|uniref:hypothetical protein n=1 Tax=Aestuariivirga litoralis TaxID=2650924 RepID=UPI0018C6CF8D|nr:hypothetical protein [Aestuariivirga litoralis]MBG1230937.1 hypothetical protein [Aestuariivirga litoralis]
MKARLMTEPDTLTKALKDARLAEAVQLDAILNARDARILRLGALRDAVLPELAGHDAAKTLFDLNVVEGEKPKLWIDLISWVEMEPDPKTYRLVQSRESAEGILFETSDAAEMQRFIIRYMAHRLVERERRTVNTGFVGQTVQRRYSFGELLYVWATGLLFGVLGLTAVALIQGWLKF